MKIKINVIHFLSAKKRQLTNALHCLCAFSFVICLLSGFTAYASQTPKTHVKVGFPIQEGTSYINANGDYAGYLVDYLKQLSLYVDWEIEFVQVEGDLDTQLETLMAMLQTGEIDMLGTMNRNTQLEELFLYPNYSYGISFTTLADRKGDPEWIEEDFSRWDGIRVATFPGFQSQLSDFIYYATVNDFTYEVVYCDSY